MTDPELATVAQPAPVHRRWIGFSLRTLMLAVLLCGSGMAVWWSGEPWVLAHTLRGHDWSIRTATFSPDGRRILTASYDGTACMWDADSGKPVAKFIGHERGQTDA